MADTTVTPVTQLDKAGLDLAAVLTLSSNYALNVFNRKNKLLPMIFTKRIRGGKSVQFPRIGNGRTFLHSRGKNIFDASNELLNSISRNNVLVKVDRPMISPVPIDREDDLMNDFDTVSAHLQSLSEAMARDVDRKIIHAGILGARAETVHADVTGYDSVSGGTQLKKGAAIQSSESALRNAIKEAAQKLNENDAPEDRYCLLRPAEINLLTSNSTIIGSEWGGRQMAEEGVVAKIDGVNIVMSNNIPSTDIADSNTKFGSTGNENTYYGDFSNTVGLVFAGKGLQSPIAGAIANDITVDIDMNNQLYLAHLLNVHFMGGFSYLRPESLIELSSATA